MKQRERRLLYLRRSWMSKAKNQQQNVTRRLNVVIFVMMEKKKQ